MTPDHPIHPAAELLPMFDEAALQKLADDIRVTGLREPIVLWQDQLLDGRNRRRACAIAGVEPRFVDKTAEIKDPVAYVWSVNCERRHLSPSQLALVGARMRALFELEGRDRMRLGGRASGGDEEASAALREAGPHDSSARAAALVGVSPRSVDSAAAVLKMAPVVLVRAVEAGQVKVSTAADVAGAGLPAGEVEELVARGPKEILAKAKEIRATRGAEQRAKRTEKLERIASGNGPLDVSRRYPVLEIDPPWLYDAGTTDPSRRVDQKYPPMTLDEIKALPIAQLATDAAVLYLWATNPLLPEAIDVGRSWGFVYKTNWCWDKEITGMGVWGLGQHELLLIFTRGNMPTPPEGTRPPSMLRARRRGEHSSKPVEVKERIERMFPTLPKIELFARGEVREGWSGWGNQARGDGAQAADDDEPAAAGDLDGDGPTAPLVCRVPTPEEQLAFAVEFPQHVAPWPAAPTATATSTATAATAEPVEPAATATAPASEPTATAGEAWAAATAGGAYTAGQIERAARVYGCSIADFKGLPAFERERVLSALVCDEACGYSTVMRGGLPMRGPKLETVAPPPAPAPAPRVSNPRQRTPYDTWKEAMGDEARCTSVCDDPESLAFEERCMLVAQHSYLCLSGGMTWRGKHVHPDSCLDCAAAPGEQHLEGCDDYPAICGQPSAEPDPDPAVGDWRLGGFDRTGQLVSASHGVSESEARKVADRWQGMKMKRRLMSIEIANGDGKVMERRERVGSTWAVRKEEPPAAVVESDDEDGEPDPDPYTERCTREKCEGRVGKPCTNKSLGGRFQVPSATPHPERVAAAYKTAGRELPPPRCGLPPSMACKGSPCATHDGQTPPPPAPAATPTRARGKRGAKAAAAPPAPPAAPAPRGMTRTAIAGDVGPEWREMGAQIRERVISAVGCTVHKVGVGEDCTGPHPCCRSRIIDFQGQRERTPLTGPVGPLDVHHRACRSKRANGLIRHAESAAKARNYESAREAIDELDGISSPELTAEDSHAAAVHLRAWVAELERTQGPAEEAPPRGGARRVPAAKAAPSKAPAKGAEPPPPGAAPVCAGCNKAMHWSYDTSRKAWDYSCGSIDCNNFLKCIPVKARAGKGPKPPRDPKPIDLNATRDAALIKSITAAYSSDLTDQIRKPVEIDGRLWTSMGGVHKGKSSRITLWRLTPWKSWSGKFFVNADLVRRYDVDTWRGDHTGHHVRQGKVNRFVLDGTRRVYRWGPEKL